MRLQRALVLTLFVAAFSCDGAPPAEDSDAIRQAVFEYQFAHNRSSIQQAAGVYCLEIDGSDPSEKFMRRFALHVPPVRPQSACSGVGGIHEAATGAKGILFRIHDLRRVGTGKAEVEGGYYEGNRSASSNTYYLEWKDGRWMVVRERLRKLSRLEPAAPPNPALRLPPPSWRG